MLIRTFQKAAGPPACRAVRSAILVAVFLAAFGGSAAEVPGEAQPWRFEMRLGQYDPAPGLEPVVRFADQPVFMEEAFVRIRLNDNGAKTLARVTGANTGRLLCGLIEGRLLMAPVIQAPITGGRMALASFYTEAEAKRVADRITGRPAEPLDLDDAVRDLRSDEWEKRCVAAIHLGEEELRSDEALTALGESLGDRHGLVDRYIKESLLRYGADAVPQLERALGSMIPLRANGAIDVITFMGPEAAAVKPALYELLEFPLSVEPHRIVEAILAVSPGEAGVLPRLIRMLDEPGNIDGTINLIASLGEAGVPAIPSLIEHARSAQGITAVDYGFAFQRFGPAAADAVPLLLQWAGDLEGDVAESECDSLNEGAPTNANEYLSHPGRAKCARERLRRSVAVSALAAIHSRADVVVPFLAETLRERSYLTESSAIALAYFGRAAAPAIPDIKTRLRESEGNAKRALWIALGSARGDCSRYVDHLIELLDDVEWIARTLAAVRLGELGPVAADALPKLEALTWDDEPAVREAAARAVERIEG
jgi:hypothetical protein